MNVHVHLIYINMYIMNIILLQLIIHIQCCYSLSLSGSCWYSILDFTLIIKRVIVAMVITYILINGFGTTTAVLRFFGRIKAITIHWKVTSINRQAAIFFLWWAIFIRPLFGIAAKITFKITCLESQAYSMLLFIYLKYKHFDSIIWIKKIWQVCNKSVTAFWQIAIPLTSLPSSRTNTPYFSTLVTTPLC